MNTLEKAEHTASICHIERFSKSGILIYNSKVPDMAGSKTRRRRITQAIAKRYAFHPNAKSVFFLPFFRSHSFKKETFSLQIMLCFEN